MSRAFVKEDGPERIDLPDLPIPTHPNYVTPRGLADLRARLAARQADLAALRARDDRTDRLPEAAAERDIRYLEARLASAIPVDPPAAPAEVGFATVVRVAEADGTERTFAIVGEDEADAAAGRITAHAPLARALIGAAVGDTIAWDRPGGAVEFEILSIGPAPCP
jgi:transcription elongation GreA/GreB family factor